MQLAPRQIFCQGDAGAAWLDERTFPTVAVETGTYKYVLIHASDGRTERTLVRSGPGDYHKDVANTTVRALSKLNVQVSAQRSLLRRFKLSCLLNIHTRTHNTHTHTHCPHDPRSNGCYPLLYCQQ
jgi:hypothetical protein